MDLCRFSENQSRGLGSSNKFLRLSAPTIFEEKRAVYRQVICLLSSKRMKQKVFV